MNARHTSRSWNPRSLRIASDADDESSQKSFSPDSGQEEEESDGDFDCLDSRNSSRKANRRKRQSATTAQAGSMQTQAVARSCPAQHGISAGDPTPTFQHFSSSPAGSLFSGVLDSPPLEPGDNLFTDEEDAKSLPAADTSAPDRPMNVMDVDDRDDQSTGHDDWDVSFMAMDADTVSNDEVGCDLSQKEPPMLSTFPNREE
jgi:hypothetical protein